jgi:hypothetical protein
VVNVTDRADVDVRFAAIKFFFRHRNTPRFRFTPSSIQRTSLTLDRQAKRPAGRASHRL